MKYRQIDNGSSFIFFTQNSDIYIADKEYGDQMALEIEKQSVPVSVKKSTESIKKGNIKKLKKLVILTTNACNLRCRYCYLNYGKHDHADQTGNVAVEDVKIAIHLILDQYTEGISFIQFFGGEPLLAICEIKEIYEYIQSTFTKRHLPPPQFGLVTNGVFLDHDVIDFFNQSKIGVTISLDGDQELHDKVRKKVDQSGCYKEIKGNIERYLPQLRTNVYYELTLNREHVLAYRKGKCKKWLEAIKETGLRAGIIGIVEYSKDHSLDFKAQDSKKLKQMYQELVDYYFQQLSTNSPQLYNLDINRLVIKILSKKIESYSCQTGTAQMTISVNGDFYPCPKFIMKDFQMGSVKENTFSSAAIKSVVQKDQRESCDGCWVRHICGSYCYSLKYRNKDNRDVIPIRCIHMRLLIENIIIKIVEYRQKGQLEHIIDQITVFSTELKQRSK